WSSAVSPVRAKVEHFRALVLHRLPVLHSTEARDMQAVVSHLREVEWVPSELPCSFSSFVAARRGISVHDAEKLIEHWLETYEPCVRPAHSLPTETGDAREPGTLPICA